MVPRHPGAAPHSGAHNARWAPAQASTASSGADWLPGVEGISYGGDYNPEQWPEEVWHEDVALMHQAGVNLVSVGVFSWGLLEPREGQYEFGWLDRVIDLLYANGIRVDLATPTASPPAWFFHAYPQARVMTRDGTTLGFGSRGMASPASAAYRRACVEIARALAVRYGQHPALALWHVHNEYGAPVAEDYSEASAKTFRLWLQRRYGSLDALNEAWGTAFWGQHYGAWEHVGVPARAPSVVNPAQRLDFARYTNDILLECFKEQRDVLHAYAPGIPVTTNFMAGTCPSLDLWSWAREVDLVSNDQYLDASDSRNYVGLALAADLTRSLAGGSPWILMEHSTSAVNWQPRNIAKRPGELSRNSLAHLGRGADAILFFQWRASRYGAEKFHSAMLPHAGPHTRVFREVVDLGGQLQRLAELQGSRVKAQVAILWDWESFWAQDLEWRPSVDLSHEERIKTFYDRLWRDKVAVDFAHPEADLFSYRLVLAPASYLLTDAAAENVRSYVEAGGTLLVSYFSAVVDEHDTVRPGGAGQALADVLGLTVDEFLPLREGEIVQLDGFDVEGKARSIEGRTWSEDVRLRGADVVAHFVDGPGAGKPAVTTHALGAGQSWYVATSLDVGALDVVMEEVYRRAGITPCRTLPEDVEVVERRDIGRSYTFVINHTDRSVAMEFTGRDLLAREEVYRGSQVAPGSVRVISSERE